MTEQHITRKQLRCKKVMTHPIGLLATWFGSGLAPFAPGTFGTLAALPFAWIIQQYLGNTALLIAAIIISIIGVPICNAYMKRYNRSHDPKEVVIDEVAGVWLVLFFCPQTIIGYSAGFILFRIFDIWKPFPISWIDSKVGGGLGVMLDDVLAAVFAIIVGMSTYLFLENSQVCDGRLFEKSVEEQFMKLENEYIPLIEIK